MTNQEAQAENCLFIETILILRNDEIPLLKEHYDRFRRTIQRYGEIPPSSGEFESLLREAIPEKGGIQPRRCRLVYGTDGNCSEIRIWPFRQKRLNRVGLIELPAASYPLKFADRCLFASLHARFPEYDEIIITRRGFLSDGTFTNLYLHRPNKKDGEKTSLLTPSTPLLAGCRRARLIKEGRLVATPLLWNELEDGWQIGFINALNPPGQLGEIAVSQVINLNT